MIQLETLQKTITLQIKTEKQYLPLILETIGEDCDDRMVLIDSFYDHVTDMVKPYKIIEFTHYNEFEVTFEYETNEDLESIQEQLPSVIELFLTQYQIRNSIEWKEAKDSVI